MKRLTKKQKLEIYNQALSDYKKSLVVPTYYKLVRLNTHHGFCYYFRETLPFTPNYSKLTRLFPELFKLVVKNEHYKGANIPYGQYGEYWLRLRVELLEQAIAKCEQESWFQKIIKKFKSLFK